jgi:hypothetical protein
MTRRERREAWYIDHINDAATSSLALERAWEWVKAELERAADQRPEDAEGFRWQFVDALAQWARAIRVNHPHENFRNLGGKRPHLPGGGWRAKTPGGDHPGARAPWSAK